MSNAYLCPILQENQWSDDALFLAGGLMWFYEAGTTAPQTAYQDIAATIPWSNPIVLDARGETGGEIWLKEGKTYKIILEGPPLPYQAHGTVISDFDNVTGINDPSANPLQADWQRYTTASPVYISATSFSILGDVTPIFTVNRRIKSDCAAGLQSGMVKTSVYDGAKTTVTLIMDVNNALDNGMSDIYYGFIETQPSSIPVAVLTGTASTASSDSIKIAWNSTTSKASLTINSTDYTQWPIDIVGSAGPTGMVIMYAGQTPPSGYLIADGSQVSRTTYANLFAVIGTTFGSGDGSLSFTLPNLVGYFMRGWDSSGTVDPNTSTQSGTTASSSVTITGLSDTTYLVVGMGVSGSGIPSGTKIATIVSSTSITLTNAATASATVTLTFSGRQFGSIQQDSNAPISLTDPGHKHTVEHFAATSGGGYGPTDGSTNASPVGTFDTSSVSTGITLSGSGLESRPKNIALLPCIKY